MNSVILILSVVIIISPSLRFVRLLFWRLVWRMCGLHQHPTRKKGIWWRLCGWDVVRMEWRYNCLKSKLSWFFRKPCYAPYRFLGKTGFRSPMNVWKSAIFTLTSANICARLGSHCACASVNLTLWNFCPPHKLPEAFWCRKEAEERGKRKRAGENGKGKEKKKRSCLFPLSILHCSFTIFDFIGLASFISWRWW